MSEETKTILLDTDQGFSSPKIKRACFIVLQGSDLGKQILIHDESLSIGRSKRADLEFNEPSLSRVHANLNKSTKGFCLQDNNSTNGTFVNNIRVQSKELNDGDVIRMGVVILKFLSSDNLELAYHERIKELKDIDALTQIFNKRVFMESLSREMDISKNERTPMGLNLFDVDFFKKVNDTYGHLAGDYVLSHMAKSISSSLPSHFIFARYGGEEFAIVMPGTNLRESFDFAEKIRLLILKTEFKYQNRLMPISISLGVAEYDGLKPLKREDLIEKVDNALYQAKQSGRNQVCRAF